MKSSDILFSASQLFEIGAVQKSRTSVFLVHLIKQLGRVQSYFDHVMQHKIMH